MLSGEEGPDGSAGQPYPGELRTTLGQSYVGSQYTRKSAKKTQSWLKLHCLSFSLGNKIMRTKISRIPDSLNADANLLYPYSKSCRNDANMLWATLS